MITIRPINKTKNDKLEQQRELLMISNCLSKRQKKTNSEKEMACLLRKDDVAIYDDLIRKN